MKNISTKTVIFLLTITAIIFIIPSCGDNNDNKYETRYSSDGKDSVVYVHYRDDNGNYQDFFINYLMFRSLFNNGGYGACYNYYISHPAPRINNYHYYQTNTNRNSYVGSRNEYTPRYSSGSGSSYKPSSTTRSYSSPSRSYSSPSRSYSSPSRSYSSPSRSYSSPSRSYSSPSRSYSSPSRH